VTYGSVDTLQRTLADSVFTYAADRKKAAGRALGTLVEIVTYYTLRAWDFRDHIVIERSLPEFANPDITHNVEFSLHPILWRLSHRFAPPPLPLTASKLRRTVPDLRRIDASVLSKSNQLLSTDRLVRNACVLAEDREGPIVANVDTDDEDHCEVVVSHLHRHPFAIFECKRVGVEEGMRKGPQTIEKAKQGAYVARTVSSLQKVRSRNGQVLGVIERSGGGLYCQPYGEVLREIVNGSDADLLADFILTVGVVSNHGNWFTSENHNKELKVLAQSYDWLLFLTDEGLGQFIQRLLLKPSRELAAARTAFLASYSGKHGRTRFTKVTIDIEADAALRRYFLEHEAEIEGWYNVIAQRGCTLAQLREDLGDLRKKNWKEILER